MALTPWDNSAWRPDFSNTVADSRPPTLHGRIAPPDQVMEGRALAGRALWLVQEGFNSQLALEHVRAMAAGDCDVARLAQDFLGFTNMSTSSRSQARAFFLISELRADIDRPPARPWWRRILS